MRVPDSNLVYSSMYRKKKGKKERKMVPQKRAEVHEIRRRIPSQNNSKIQRQKKTLIGKAKKNI